MFSVSLLKKNKKLPTSQANRTERAGIRKWFKSLSDLRGKERSLLHGDYYPLYSSNTSLAFLRLWDQSERYITAVNWGAKEETLKLKLPPTGKLQEKSGRRPAALAFRF